MFLSRGRIQGAKIKRTNLVHFLFFLVATVICSIYGLCHYLPGLRHKLAPLNFVYEKFGKLKTPLASAQCGYFGYLEHFDKAKLREIYLLNTSV